jgi:hypothetical protein
MPPKFNRRRALFVLGKIDEILAWEQRKETERDTKFVELGRYLCEVRAGQYWRLENLKSFDAFLGTRFPESRRKAYYLMSIHENLPPQARKELTKVGWAKGIELAKLARRDRQHFDCATWLHKARELSKEDFQQAAERELTGKLTEPWEIVYFKLYESQTRAGDRDGSSDVGKRPLPRLLLGNDLCGLPGAAAGVSWRRRRGLHEPDASRPSRLATGCVVAREAAAAGAASRWLEVSIVRCDVKLGGSPQPVSQPLRPRFRRQPNQALRPVPCRHPSLKNTNSASTARHSRRCPRDCAGRSIPETRSVFAGSSTASQIETAFGRAAESGAIFARAFDNTKLSITRASMPEQK